MSDLTMRFKINGISVNLGLSLLHDKETEEKTLCVSVVIEPGTSSLQSEHVPSRHHT